MLIAEEMKDEWWERRKDRKAYEIIRELYLYADERAARLERLEQQASIDRAKPTAARSVESEAPARPELPPIELAREVDANVMAVLERTKEYYDHPDRRPPDPVKRRPPKSYDKLSERSRIDYKRTRIQIGRELKERGLSSYWDLVLQLVETARYKSKPTYKKQRTALLRSLGKFGQVCDMIKSAPSLF